MIYTKKFKATIVDGPSKMDLLAALAYAFDKKRGAFSVTFSMIDEHEKLKEKKWRKIAGDKGMPMEAQITGLQHEGGSGESFLIEGHLAYYSMIRDHKVLYDTRFSARYSTRSRKGTATIELYAVDDKKTLSE